MEEDRSVILGVEVGAGPRGGEGYVSIAGWCLSSVPSYGEQESPGGPEEQLLPQGGGQHRHPLPGRKVGEATGRRHLSFGGFNLIPL